MKLKITQLIFIPIILTFFAFNNLYAQGITTAAINGTILDVNGKPVVGANIVAIHLSTGSKFGISSRIDGKYNLQNLKVGGPYQIKVTMVGFADAQVNDVNLKLGQNFRLDFTLTEKAIEMGTIHIFGDRGSIISANRTGAATTVAKEQIESFPTIDRSFQNFAKFTPQFSGTGSSAAGRNNRFNNIQIDGTQYNDLFGLGSSGTPGSQASTNPISLDAIQEFQVLIAPFDVRQSGFTGGGINAITRSGTNLYSGSAYFYGRNQNFLGKSPDTLKAKFKEFSEYQAGFRVGGPIIKDKLFFFLSGEMTSRTEPQDNISLTQYSNPDTVRKVAEAFRNILADSFGYNPGSYESFTAKRPSVKLFARLDWNISDNHRLTIRHNFVDANDDNIPRNLTTFLFEDRNYKFKSQTNSTVAQLTSTFGNNWANELIVGYTRIRDSRDASASPFPSVTINQLTGLSFKVGAEEYSQANRLDQDILEFTNNLTHYIGDHVITVGTRNEFYWVENLFIRDLYGTYQFSSLANFAKRIPSRFSISYSKTGDPKQSAKFNSFQIGLYAQDEWTVMPNLKVTFGIRADIPFFPVKPAYNDSVNKYFGYLGIGTDKVPTGQILFSPRVGFNFDVMNDKITQVRGGLGLFTGRTPYVWISNQYGNTGVEFARIDMTSGIPNFVSDPNNQPIDPTKAGKTTEVDLTDKNFKLPQLMRYNIAVDRQLPFGLVGTVEFIYSKSVNDIVYQDINIDTENGVTYLPDSRPVYSKRISSANFTNVLLMKNTSLGYQYNLTFQIQKEASEGLFGTLAFTLGKAKDQNSVVSSQAFSQWRYNPIPGNPNDPPLTTSNFEIKNRLFAAVSYAKEFYAGWKTTVSLFYNAQAGRPFSYVYLNDVNGDGQTTNDLVYIPRDQDDKTYILVKRTGSTIAAATQQEYDDLFAYINSDDYLKNNKGKIMERNGAYEPWIHQIDFRLSQEIPNPFVAGNNLQITVDILNVLNFINSEWGWVKTVPNQTDNLFRYEGKVTTQTDPNYGKPQYSFTKKADPFQKDNVFSRWQMQLGVRYNF